MVKRIHQSSIWVGLFVACNQKNYYKCCFLQLGFITVVWMCVHAFFYYVVTLFVLQIHLKTPQSIYLNFINCLCPRTERLIWSDLNVLSPSVFTDSLHGLPLNSFNLFFVPLDEHLIWYCLIILLELQFMLLFSVCASPINL